jgi:hypothetical protein
MKLKVVSKLNAKQLKSLENKYLKDKRASGSEANIPLAGSQDKR